MKRLIVFLGMCALISLSGGAFAQNSGLGFNYQAVIRNAYGFVLQDSMVTLKVSLYPGQTAVTPTWVETHNVKTDKFGAIGIRVGHGTRDNASTVAQYSNVSFAAAYYWLKIEVKEAGTFREISFASLPSVPISEETYNNVSLIPAGLIMAFGGDTAQIPAGWMLCDGRQLSRSQYANLFNAIGVSWGTGDNATTFNIPDMRGVFLRGVSHGSGNDPDAATRIVLTNNGANSGNNVGSYQGDAIRNIIGTINNIQKQHAAAFVMTGVFYRNNDMYYGSGNVGTGGSPATSFTFDANAGTTSTNPMAGHANGGDIRPKNVYVNYIIKL